MDWRTMLFIPIFLKLTTSQNVFNTSDILWSDVGRNLGLIIRDCWTVSSSPSTVSQNYNQSKIDYQKQNTEYISQKSGQIFDLSKCLQKRARTAMKILLNSNVIPLADGIDLVKYQDKTSENQVKRVSRMDEGFNSPGTSLISDWKSLVMDAIYDIIHTYAVRITMNDLQPSFTNEARRRRKQNYLMPLMIFGLVGLGMILIPMGFQFLAVLGGKALLLAKMALLLTSIQGLKKIAHSNINYGLYHSAPENPWYDRKSEDIEYPNRVEDIYYNYFPNKGYSWT